MPASLRRRGAVLPALLGLALLAFTAAPAPAQQASDPPPAIDQYNAVNGENQRHTNVQSQLRDQEFQQRLDSRNGVIGCQGTAAQAACLNQLKLQTQRQKLDLGQGKLQEQEQNWQNRQTLRQQPFPYILQGTSVRPKP